MPIILSKSTLTKIIIIPVVVLQHNTELYKADSCWDEKIEFSCSTEAEEGCTSKTSLKLQTKSLIVLHVIVTCTLDTRHHIAPFLMMSLPKLYLLFSYSQFFLGTVPIILPA